MNPLVRSLSLFVSFFITVNASAQEGISAMGSQGGNSSDQSQSTLGTTEDTNASQGGFLGVGGQKQMQRVRGLPLPTRSSRQLYAASQPSSEREVSSSFSGRRSKQLMGEVTTDFPARMIYLNGKNISTIREQQLDGVNVRIDSQGNVHILAPHYEVQESTHYRPLLPHDIPRVSKPVPGQDEPLLSGRLSKPINKQDDVKNRQAAGVGVPPIEADKDEPQSSGAPVKPTEGADKAAPEQKEKPQGDGRKL